MEEYSENTQTFKDRGGCGRCPYCLGDHKQFTDTIDRRFVASTLQVKLPTLREPVLASDFVKFLTDAANKNEMKRLIWTESGRFMHLLRNYWLLVSFDSLWKTNPNSGRMISLRKTYTSKLELSCNKMSIISMIEEFAINCHSLWEPFNYDRQRWEARLLS